VAALALVVSAIVTVVHWPVLDSKAVYFDDQLYITQNAVLGNPSWRSAWIFLRELKPSTAGGYYHPLSMIAIMVQYAAGGRVDNLRPFLAANLALHVANVVLLIVLAHLLLRQPWAAGAVGLLFGLHPQSVESIAWATQQKNLLSTAFALACMVAYVQFARSAGPKARLRGGAWYGLSLAAMTAGLLAKPSVVSLPVLLLVLDFWPLRRFGWRTLLEKVPFFAVGVLSAVITYQSQSATAFTTTIAAQPLTARLLIVLHNLAFYPFKIAWPVALSAHYPAIEALRLTHPMVMAGSALTLLGTTALLRSLRYTRAALAGAAIFLVALLPSIGLIGYTNTIAADRYAYFPLIGLLLALGALLVRLFGPAGAGLRLSRRAAAALFATGAVGAALAGVTRAQIAHWRDTETLFEHLLAQDFRDAPAAPLLLLANAGVILEAQGAPDRAARVYRQALALPPDRPAYYASAVRVNLGNIQLSYGGPREALRLFREALALMPDSAYAMNGVAWVLATHADPALRDGGEALRLAQQLNERTGFANPSFLDTLAAAYAEMGQFDRALNVVERAEQRAAALHRPDLLEALSGARSEYEAGRARRIGAAPSP
jgi:tetratricopeptide (TPR) repeat protein